MKLLGSKEKLLLALSCTLYAVESVMVALQVYINGKIVEYAVQADLQNMICAVLFAFLQALLLYFLIAVATLTRLTYLSNCEFSMVKDIVHSVFRRPVKSFRGECDAFYLNLLTTDVQIYRTDYLNNLPYLINAVVSLIVSAMMLYKMNLWLLCVGILMALLPLSAIKPFSTLEQKSKSAYSQSAEKYTNSLKEQLEGYETIRSCCAEAVFQRRFESVLMNRQNAWRKYNFLSTMSYESLMSVASFSNVICLGIGGWLVANRYLTAGMLFSAANYFSALSNNFANISDYYISMRSTKEVLSKLENQRSISLVSPGGFCAASPCLIHYSNVSFSFSEKKILDHFSYHFIPGGCYAIVGESGIGKTTLINLLLKYYDDYQGSIFLGDYDIKNLSEADIYSRIGIVSQSPFLFDASLEDNITMFSNNPQVESTDYQALLDSLGLSALAEHVGSGNLGDFGDKISGGERQRIALARVLIRKPEIIIFDEPSSALDPVARNIINQLIFNLHGCTRIVITHEHEESFLSNFDDIISL